MAKANPDTEGSMSDSGEEGYPQDRMEVDEEASRLKKRSNEEVSGESISLTPEETDFIKERRKKNYTAKKAKKTEGGADVRNPTSRTLFSDTSPNKIKDKEMGVIKGGSAKESPPIKKSVEENGACKKSKEEEDKERKEARDLARDMGISATDSCDPEGGGRKLDTRATSPKSTNKEGEPIPTLVPLANNATGNNDGSGFSLSTSDQKRNRRIERQEMEREQKARNARNKIIENVLGIDKKVQNKTIVISLENRADTMINVEKSTNLHITSILSSQMDIRDIIEVRKNSIKKKGHNRD